jgi:hypothetical protein
MRMMGKNPFQPGLPLTVLIVQNKSHDQAQQANSIAEIHEQVFSIATKIPLPGRKHSLCHGATGRTGATPHGAAT